MTKEEVAACTILRGVAGSRLLGLHTPESDTDILGVCVEPISEAVGLGQPFEQWTNEQEQTQIYGLRKFCRLIVKGNPSMLNLLFMPSPDVLSSRGRELQGLAPQIVSKACSGPFLGYLQAQRERLMGERGQRGVRRKDLEERFGFDTKYAMHMLRLGVQGIELLTNGSLTLPMDYVHQRFLLGVRNGVYSYDDCLEMAKDMESQLQVLYKTSPLRDRPDVPAVEAWMTKTYLDQWEFDRHVSR